MDSIENIKKLIAHVADKEFIQFSSKYKNIMKEKIQNHSCMIDHTEKMKKYEDQQNSYSQITNPKSGL